MRGLEKPLGWHPKAPAAQPSLSLSLSLQTCVQASLQIRELAKLYMAFIALSSLIITTVTNVNSTTWSEVWSFLRQWELCRRLPRTPDFTFTVFAKWEQDVLVPQLHREVVFVHEMYNHLPRKKT